MTIVSKYNSKVTENFLKESIEDQYFDRKSSRIKPKDIAQHLSAFANGNGGCLAIGIAVSDIDSDVLNAYKNKLKTNLSDEEILDARGFIYQGKLTVAGAVLFAKNPEKFFPSCRIRFIRYDGLEGKVGTEMNIIKDISIYGPLHKMLEESKVVISSQLRDFQSLNPKTGRFDIVTEYPEFAWQEGIVNAVTHRDYSIKGEHIKVIMYDDRLEILSPGKLPNIVNIKNLKYTRYSRNPKIARVLSEFGWVKELNEGVKRIYKEMSDYFLDEPKFSEPNMNSLKLTLKNNIVMRKIRNMEQMSAKFTTELWDTLSSDEITAIELAYKHNKVTTKMLEDELGRDIRVTRKILNTLRDKKILEWNGTSQNDPKQYYKISNEKHN